MFCRDFIENFYQGTSDLWRKRLKGRGLRSGLIQKIAMSIWQNQPQHLLHIADNRQACPDRA
jgi:hypothetical protein